MTGMGGVLRTLALLGLAAAVIVGGRFLWNRRPWRPAVVVNGRILSVGELDLRARALLDDARQLLGHLLQDVRGAARHLCQARRGDDL